MNANRLFNLVVRLKNAKKDRLKQWLLQ